MNNFIITTRGIRNGSFSSEPGPTRFLKIPTESDPNPSHEINRSAFIEEVVGTPAAQKCDDIVFFIHGYNVTQQDLMKRHRSIRAGLSKAGFIGAILSFDWPAKGSAANYLEIVVPALSKLTQSPNPLSILYPIVGISMIPFSTRISPTPSPATWTEMSSRHELQEINFN